MTDRAQLGEEVEHAYERYECPYDLEHFVETAQRADHAAQRVDREHYSHFRTQAFERRKLARQALDAPTEAPEVDHDWPTFGEITNVERVANN